MTGKEKKEVVEIPSKLYCKTCGKLLKNSEFYTSYNVEKYPNGGKLDECRKCITMLVNVYDPETFVWILREIDVPYIKEVWDATVDKYKDDPTKFSSTSILGRYLTKMHMSQYNMYRFKDTEKIANQEKEDKMKAMRQRGWSEEQITEYFNNEAARQKEEQAQAASRYVEMALKQEGDGYSDKPLPVEEKDEFEDKLTEEDKVKLSIKWGNNYRPSEWVRLEQLYNDMMNSYDIQGAGQIDNLKFICKTSLKANQLIDMNDFDGFQKLSKVYDQLMKSGKLTGAQTKTESGNFVDSIGELVAMCEKEGFIPRFYTEEPRDKVDKVILDLQNYTRDLVTEELNLGNMIEQSLKQIKEQLEEDRNNTDADNAEDDSDLDDEELEKLLFEPQENTGLTVDDIDEINDLEDEMEDSDVAYIEKLLRGEV